MPIPSLITLGAKVIRAEQPLSFAVRDRRAITKASKAEVLSINAVGKSEYKSIYAPGLLHTFHGRRYLQDRDAGRLIKFILFALTQHCGIPSAALKWLNDVPENVNSTWYMLSIWTVPWYNQYFLRVPRK
jgi:hypothetical protein